MKDSNFGLLTLLGEDPSPRGVALASNQLEHHSPIRVVSRLAQLGDMLWSHGQKQTSSSSSSMEWMLTHGSWVASPNYNYFKGQLDEVRVYGRALTREEINFLAQP